MEVTNCCSVSSHPSKMTKGIIYVTKPTNFKKLPKPPASPFQKYPNFEKQNSPYQCWGVNLIVILSFLLSFIFFHLFAISCIP